MLEHLLHSTFWHTLSYLLDLLVYLQRNRVRFMVISIIQHIVPCESVIEPNIENLVSFLEFIRYRLIPKGQ
jgi:hypothetical protein